MTKRRPPLSVDAALSRIAGQLDDGWDDMARVLDCAPGYLRACGDPDRREKIAVVDAIKLDLAYEAAGGEGYPLHECYAAQLDVAAAARFASNFDLLRHTAELIKEGGEAHSALVRAGLPHATPADRRAALKELADNYEVIKPLLALLSEATAEHDSPGIGTVEVHQTGPPGLSASAAS